MKKCEKCNVKILNNRVTCPLCKSTLIETNEVSNNLLVNYPTTKNLVKKIPKMIKILIFLSIFIILASIWINIATLQYASYLWCLPISFFITSIWIITYELAIKRKHFNRNMFFLIPILVLLLYGVFFIDSLNRQVTYALYNDYIYLYVLPGLMGVEIMFFTIRALIKKKFFAGSVIYMFLLSIFCIAHAIISLCLKIDFLHGLVSYTIGFCALFTIPAMFIFDFKTTKDELAKKFIV